ncbi:MAG TPA: sialidase family protein [Tepidisphaeraceae bacterium]
MSPRTSVPVRPLARVEGLESRTFLSATVVGTPTIANAAKLAGPQSNESVAINPANPQEVFVASDNDQSSIYFAKSVDGGTTWTGKAMFTGADGFPQAFGNPSLATDKYGNLFLAYETSDTHAVEVLMSYDSGANFHIIDRIKTFNSEPVVATGTNAVWVAFRQQPGAGATGSIAAGGAVAYGAQVTGLGRVKSFKAETITTVQSNVHDLAVGPAGQVTAAYVFSTAAGPQQIYTSTDLDGLGHQGFGAANNQIATQVGNHDLVPPQNTAGIDPSVSIAYDLSADQFTGRLYLAYVDAGSTTTPNTTIMLRFSDDNGLTFSAPIAVNDDSSGNGHFDPHVAVDPVTGAVGVTWYDARNDNGLQVSGGGTDTISNNDVQVYGAVGTPSPTGVVFSNNFVVQPAYSNPADISNNGSLFPGPPTSANQLGRKTTSVFYNSQLFPVWADNSNSTADNGDGPLAQPDIYVGHVNVSVTGTVLGTFIGSFGDSNGTLSYTTSAGTRATFSLHGGQGFVLLETDGTLSVHLSGTTAKSALTIRGTGGTGRVTLGSVLINGTIGTINAPTADLAGTFSIQGAATRITLGNISGGTLASTGAMKQITIAAISAGNILSGANPGGDGIFAGAGDLDDTFGAGSIGSLRVLGAITGSVIGAGVNPVDGIFGNGDDGIVGGTASSIGSIVAGSADATTRFEAGSFHTARLPSPVDPATDPRFVL